MSGPNWVDDPGGRLVVEDSNGDVSVVWHEYHVRDPETGEMVPADPPAQPDEAARHAVSESEMPEDWNVALQKGNLTVDKATNPANVIKQ